MKINKLICQLFTALILTGIALALNGCSDSDNETSINNSCQTFLECQDKTVWENVPSYIGDFLKFQNNQNNPWVAYWTYEGECYHVNNSIDTEDITIIENSKNILKYRTGYEGGQYRAIHTFTYSNGKIIFKDEFYVNDNLDGVYIYTFEKSDLNLNSLTFCD